MNKMKEHHLFEMLQQLKWRQQKTTHIARQKENNYILFKGYEDNLF